MRILVIALLFSAFALPVFSQKMLFVEKTNKVKPRKFYINDPLVFRLAGQENYWYDRTINEIFPERSLLLLDLYPVHIDSISAIKIPRKLFYRRAGASFITLGATLTLASTLAFLNRKNDEQPYNFPFLFGSAGISMLIGIQMVRPITLKMGKRHRLRTVEVRF